MLGYVASAGTSERPCQMQRACYFLIVLLLSAPFDDTWVDVPVLSSPSVPDDNDEYLPQEREQGNERSATRRPEPFVRLKADIRGSWSGDLRGMTLCNLIFAGHFDPPLLYVFMSLQC
jgi:hypothetical protein